MKKLRSMAYSTLRWSERYAKTDMVYLFKGSFWLVLGQGVAAVSSFVLAIFFARYMSKDAYGTYKYIFSVAGIISTFTLTGLGTALIQSVARGYGGTLKQAFIVSMKWSVPMILISLGTSVYYFFNGNSLLGWMFIIFAIINPFLQSFQLYTGYLSGLKNFRRLTYFGVIQDIIVTATIIVALFITNSPLILASLFFGANMITNAVFFLDVYRNRVNRDKVDPEALTYSKHLSAINILLNISAQLDKIFVYHYIGAVELAIYTFALAVPKQIRAVAGLVGSLAMPKLSNRSVKEIRSSIYKKFWTSQIILIPITLGYIIFAPYIYKIFFPQYMSAVFYSRVYVLFLPLFGNFADVALTAKRAIRERYILNVGMSIFNIILMFIFVHIWGMLGVIIAIVITKYITAILSFVFIHRLPEDETPAESPIASVS